MEKQSNSQNTNGFHIDVTADTSTTGANTTANWSQLDTKTMRKPITTSTSQENTDEKTYRYKIIEESTSSK